MNLLSLSIFPTIECEEACWGGLGIHQLQAGERLWESTDSRYGSEPWWLRKVLLIFSFKEDKKGLIKLSEPLI